MRTPRSLPLVAVALLSLFHLGADCGGYDFGPDGIHGTQGRYQLSLWFAPLLAGSVKRQVYVSSLRNQRSGCGSGGASEWVSLESSAPAVLAVSGDSVSGNLTVESGVAGDVELRLLDAAHNVLDTFPVQVRQATALELVDSPGGVLLQGTRLAECVAAHAGTEELDATGIVGIEGTGAISVERPSLPIDCPGDTGEAIITGTAAGMGRFTASAIGGSSAGRDYEVIAPAAVDKVTMTLVTGVGIEPGAASQAVNVTFSSAGRSVLFGDCEWVNLDPSVTVSFARTFGIIRTASSLATLYLDKPGTFTLTCRVPGGSTSASLTLWRK